jgi:hypothetical protein
MSKKIFNNYKQSVYDLKHIEKLKRLTLNTKNFLK